MGNSAIGRGTAIEDYKVKASSGGTPDFLDGIVDGDTIVVNSNILESVNEFYVGETTRTMATGAGTQAITGVGFTPKAVSFGANYPAQYAWSKGYDDGTSAKCIYELEGSYVSVLSSHSIAVAIAAFTYRAVITSFDADGFTITWSVASGSPSGTAYLNFMAYK